VRFLKALPTIFDAQRLTHLIRAERLLKRRAARQFLFQEAVFARFRPPTHCVRLPLCGDQPTMSHLMLDANDHSGRQERTVGGGERYTNSTLHRPAPAAPATSGARGLIKKGVQGSDSSMLKDRNVGTRDNRRGSGGSELHRKRPRS